MYISKSTGLFLIILYSSDSHLSSFINLVEDNFEKAIVYLNMSLFISKFFIFSEINWSGKSVSVFKAKSLI